MNIEKCEYCGEEFESDESDCIDFWHIENKWICWNCKNELGLTDCCDCGAEIYVSDNEFDLWLCDECLTKWRENNEDIH